MHPLSELASLNSVGKGGADNSLPNRGTSTGLNGDTYGADISVNATNSMGKMKAGTQSAPAHESCPGKKS